MKPLNPHCIGLGLLLSVMPAIAEVTFDNTDIVAPTHQGQSFSGNRITIPANAGTQRGGNLFHSFSAFNIKTGEAVTFTRTGSSGTINNVISRVTGGMSSTIDGTLRSVIPNADFYLINPNGVIFGANAVLDVRGVFHVSTADTLHFADGGHFDVTHPADTLLTTDAPEAFGFLDKTEHAAIVFNATPHYGRNIDVVGGDIRIDNGGYLYADNTAPEIRLVAMQTAGQVSVKRGDDGLLPLPATVDTQQGGQITLDLGYIGALGDGGGRISLWGRDIALQNGSRIGVWNSGALTAHADKGIAIRADALMATGKDTQIITSPLATGLADNLRIDTKTLSVVDGGLVGSQAVLGNAGDVTINTGDLVVDGKQQFATISSESLPGSSGNAGAVNIHTNNIAISSNGRISTLTQGTGNAGNVKIDTGKLTIDGEGSSKIVGISSDTLLGRGNAGNVEVNANELNILSGGRISSLTYTPGHAGNVTVTVDKLLIDDKHSEFATGITSDTARNSGNAGLVKVEARELTLLHGGQISTETLVKGLGGDINVNVSGKAMLEDGSSISSSSKGTGLGGTVTVDSQQLILRDHSTIAASSLSEAKSGDIIINANLLKVLNHSLITALNSGTGEAGTVAIKAANLNLQGRSAITVESAEGNAGDIELDVGNTLYALDSQITTTAGGGHGNGGNIAISHPTFAVLNDSDIVANALRGNGGNIDIKTHFFMPSIESRVQASSKFGLQGVVSIRSANSNIAGSIAVLSGTFVDVSALLKESCKRAASSSSFTVSTSQNLVLPSPETLLYQPPSLTDCGATL